MPSVSKKQRRTMGMAHAMQKGEMAMTPGTPAAEIAASMKPSDVMDFASTPEAGLPTRKKPASGSKWAGQPVKHFKG